MSASDFLKAVVQGAGEETGKAVMLGSAALAARYGRGLGQRIEEQMAENLLRWGRVLEERRASRLAPAGSVVSVLSSEPDVSEARFMDDAAQAAAEVDSETRHRVLADLVLARWSHGAESERAIAARDALNAVTRLTPDQLRMLGLVWAASQAPAAVDGASRILRDAYRAEANRPYDPDKSRQQLAEVQRDSDQYAESRLQELLAYFPFRQPTPTSVAQLAVAGTVDVNPILKQKLSHALARRDANERWLDGFDLMSLDAGLRTPAAAPLVQAWEGHLECCQLTLGGDLLGAIVHEMNFGGGALQQWEWGERRQRPAFAGTRLPWDGQELDPRFAEQVAKYVSGYLAREIKRQRLFGGGSRL